MTYLCLLDESGRGVRRDRWFVYGGLFLPFEQVRLLHRDIWRIRAGLRLSRETPLKWQRPVGPGASRVSSAQHDAAVDSVLDACNQRGAKLLAVLTPAGVTVSTQGRNQSIRIGASYILGALQLKFQSEDEYGVVLVDRPHGAASLDPIEEALVAGVPRGIAGYVRRRHFDRLICTGVTSIRSSRLISAVDIAIGALIFCLSCREENLERARALYRSIRPLVLRRGHPVQGNPWGLGLKIRPKSFIDPELLDFAENGWKRLRSLGEATPPPWHRPEIRLDPS